MKTLLKGLLQCAAVAIVMGSWGGREQLARGQEAPMLAPTALGPAVAAPSLAVNLLDIEPPAKSGGSVARDATVRLRGYGIYSDSSGSFSFGHTVQGVRHTIDLERTLGMDLQKYTGGASVGLDLGSEKRLHFDLSYDGYYDYTGSRDVGSISFNGKVFTATVNSSAHLQEGAGTARYDFLKPPNLGLTLSGTLGLRLFYVEAQLGEQASRLSDSVTLWVPIIEPGVAARYDLTPNLYVKGSAGGLYLGDLASYGNFTAEVGYDFNKNVGVFVGYRYWLLNYDYLDDKFHFDANNIYAGVEVRM